MIGKRDETSSKQKTCTRVHVDIAATYLYVVLGWLSVGRTSCSPKSGLGIGLMASCNPGLSVRPGFLF